MDKTKQLLIISSNSSPVCVCAILFGVVRQRRCVYVCVCVAFLEDLYLWSSSRTSVYAAVVMMVVTGINYKGCAGMVLYGAARAWRATLNGTFVNILESILCEHHINPSLLD